MGIGLATIPAAASAQSPISWIVDALRSANACAQEEAAIHGTLARLRGVSLPTSGKVLIVNIPSGVVTAYEDGHPVIESRGVVGRDLTPTPELSTYVTYVRPNPTWTVPQSIIKRKDWLTKLRDEPEFFHENGFDIVVGGNTVTPWEAANNIGRVSAFIQRPSSINALGRLKIGLHNADGIYLHDTNEPSAYNADVRAASAGCVRIESVREIAAWSLGISKHEIDELIHHGDETNYNPTQRVSVILGYWTAWPDADGRIRFYPDIYNKDGKGSECGAMPLGRRSYSNGDDYEWDNQQSLGRTIWREYEAR